MQILPDAMAKSKVKGQFQGQIRFFQQIKVETSFFFDFARKIYS